MISHSVTDTPPVVVDVQVLHELTARILRRSGAHAADANIQATQLLEAELRGHPSHGMRRLPTLVARLRAGLIRAQSQAAFDWVSAGTLRVDGDRGFGPVVAWQALERIGERAARTGIAIALVGNSNHIGILSPYVEKAARGGSITIAMTTSEALVHPWGGTAALVGTNPIAIGVPSDRDPLVLDMSTGAVSMGRILDHAARGQAIPTGWAIDESGEPTTDADAATRGAISPFGGAKGYALGIAIESIVGVLTESAFGRDVRGTLDAEFPATKGDVFVSIDLDRIGDTDMIPTLDTYLDEVRDVGGVRIPGDRSRAERAARLEGGIRVDPGLWERIVELEMDEPDV